MVLLLQELMIGFVIEELDEELYHGILRESFILKLSFLLNREVKLVCNVSHDVLQHGKMTRHSLELEEYYTSCEKFTLSDVPTGISSQGRFANSMETQKYDNSLLVYDQHFKQF